MKTLIVIAFIVVTNHGYSQRLHSGTVNSAFITSTSGTINLMSSIGEAAPITELNIGSNRLSQGYFQYQLKNTVQVLDINHRRQLSVFPNPFIDEIHIDFNHSEHEPIELKIENALGQTLYTEILTRLKSQTENYIIKLNEMASGAYILNINYINNPDKKYSIKLIKN